MCSTCHRWVHGHPTEARETGFILARNCDTPWLVPFKHPLDWRAPDCEGGWGVSL